MQEIGQLRRLAEQQAAEIKSLRLRAERAEAASAAAARQQQSQPQASLGASAAGAMTPSDSRLGQNLSVAAPGSGDSWVSFGGAAGDAPTPTLLQPATGASFRGSSSSSAAGPTPQSASEEALRSRLDLSSAALAGRNGSRAAAPPPPMRAGSGGGGTGPCSHPVAVTPSPFDGSGGGGVQSAPVSAMPSPVRSGSSAALGPSGSASPQRSASPLKLDRPGSGLSAARSTSPVKQAPGHRRTLTAPSNSGVPGALFNDLDPLHVPQ